MRKMETSSDNPCATCSMGQGCCTNLTHLKLTESEYKRHFAQYRQQLEVERYGPIYVVSGKEAHACPNWNDGCNIYHNRPMECRLYPYTIGAINRKHGRLSLGIHAHTRCPNKKELLLPEDEAKELVSSFARNAFGNKDIVEAKLEPPLTTILNLLRMKVRNKVKKLMKMVFPQVNIHDQW